MEEEDSDGEAPPEESKETDLDKYLKLPVLPLTMPDGKPADILSWWKARDHSLPADLVKGRPEGLPRLARMWPANTTASRVHLLALSDSSPLPAALTTI